MPNWITNNIEGPKTVLKKYINKDGEFDFNLIVKMPESLKVTAGTVEEHAIVAYLTNKTLNVDKITKKTDKALLEKLVKNEFAGPTWPKQIAKDVKEKSKEEIENLYNLGKAYVDNYKEYGATTWYDWCIKNWGCKWNASETEVSENKTTMSITFLTPWAPPGPVYDKIASENPNKKFKSYFYDEDYDGTHYLETINGEWFETKVVNEMDNEYDCKEEYDA